MADIAYGVDSATFSGVDFCRCGTKRDVGFLEMGIREMIPGGDVEGDDSCAGPERGIPDRAVSPVETGRARAGCHEGTALVTCGRNMVSRGIEILEDTEREFWMDTGGSVAAGSAGAEEIEAFAAAFR